MTPPPSLDDMTERMSNMHMSPSQLQQQQQQQQMNSKALSGNVPAMMAAQMLQHGQLPPQLLQQLSPNMMSNRELMIQAQQQLGQQQQLQQQLQMQNQVAPPPSPPPCTPPLLSRARPRSIGRVSHSAAPQARPAQPGNAQCARRAQRGPCAEALLCARTTLLCARVIVCTHRETHWLGRR